MGYGSQKKDQTTLSGINEVPTFAKTTPIADVINIPTIKCVDTDATGGNISLKIMLLVKDLIIQRVSQLIIVTIH